MRYLLFILIAPLLFACNDSIIYQENLKISDSNWHRNELAQFKFNINDSTARYDLYLMVRHGGNYPYKNLYLFTRTEGPRNLVAVDTAQMIFANDKGKWLGKGIGDIYDYEFKFKEAIEFPYNGEYLFQIEQALREMEIKGVTDIGIKIKKITVETNE